MPVAYYTFGCKVNQYETELIRQSFEKNGFKTAEQGSNADIIVINTCTVTVQSDLKLRKLLHRLRRENKSAVIAVCGCFAEVVADPLSELPEADIVVGNADKSRLPDIVTRFFEQKAPIFEKTPENRDYPEEEVTAFSKKTRGIIKIQDGCDRFCSYCIIPYARGRSRFKPLEKIKEEAEALVRSGHKELVVVGINLSDYGKGGDLNLSDAVKAVCESGAERVRLGSLEPELLSRDIIERLEKNKNLCPHFHLALQSGCDKTLKEMRRKYDKAEYFTIVSSLRKHFPGCAITTDIMVGFPGESDEDFAESLEFVKQIAFADAHIFPYSPRKGTPAALRSDQVPGSIKERRAKAMSETVSESRKGYLSGLVGSTVEVLFEKEKSPEFHQGHSRNYCVVKVKRFTDTLFRQTENVVITDSDGESLFGEIIQR